MNDTRIPSEQRAPPATLGTRLRHLGPGLIITGSIVGSGELIMTTKLGSEAGFALLWLVIIGCLVKVFVQVELGRYAISSAETTLEAMDHMPGPRLIVSWLVWCWLVMYILVLAQLSGIAGTAAEVFAETSSGRQLWIVLLGASIIFLLVWGRYRLVERVSTTMVFLFTLSTIVAVILLQWTDFSLSGGEIRSGLEFRLTKSDGELVNFTTAFAAFGITGVGASELIYYPYWCLEKGYARHVGPRVEGPEWERRAQGWVRVLYLDAWISCAVYTAATIAFYLLGAAVLHGQERIVENEELIGTLSAMYEESFGDVGGGLFLVGAFFVLYSTYFVATASNARLFADGLNIFRVVRYEGGHHRRRVVQIACVLVPTVCTIFFLSVGKPVSLVTAGGIAQGAMLPLLAAAALYLRYRRTDRRLRPGVKWTFFLWAAFVSMAAIGIYQVVDRISSVTRGSETPAVEEGSAPDVPSGESGARR